MYLSYLKIENFRCFKEENDCFELYLNKGLTALVGENEAGKTAVIDALRLVLGTTDREWFRLEDTDFQLEDGNFKEIKILCKFEDLSDNETSRFLEYLSYGENEDEDPVFFIHWNARHTGQLIRGYYHKQISVKTGINGDGPSIDPNLKDILQATYLRPLRDAESALTSGRGSRLAQILRNSEIINNGNDDCDLSIPLDNQELSVIGINKLINILLETQKGINGTRIEIDKNLGKLSLAGENLQTSITVSESKLSDDIRLKEMLEKLDLELKKEGKPGLGSNNLLFMACELLLLAKEKECNNLLLIEEPEAHLHAQRQLKVMKYLQNQANEQGIQILVTTHSPNLASVINLNNLVIIRNGKAYSLAEGLTKLSKSDYRFLERFLDVTKANMFFVKGLMIVEGDAENILIPTLAHLLNMDFLDHGVSIVNVGGTGLSRYSRIFQRVETQNELEIPVACVFDRDIMPNCGPVILRKVNDEEDWQNDTSRHWKVISDFNNDELAQFIQKKINKNSGQYVKSFISDFWTFEYDLILGRYNESGKYTMGLAEEVFVSIYLAKNDEEINEGIKGLVEVVKEAKEKFNELIKETSSQNGSSKEEVLATKIYSYFTLSGISKAITSQYLTNQLMEKSSFYSEEWLTENLPDYILSSIKYVTKQVS